MLSKSITTALAPISDNRYWRESDAERALAIWSQSGLTLNAFARQCGLSVSRLRRWKSKLEADGSPRFHPVEIVETADADVADSDAGIELIVGQRHRIVVRRGFDRTLLHELIEALDPC